MTAKFKTAPVTSNFVDTALQARVAAAKETNSFRKDLPKDAQSTAGQSKLFRQQMADVQKLAESHDEIKGTTEQLLALDRKRGLLIRGQQDAVRKGNIELQEHYKKQLLIVVEQAHFVAENVKLELQRKAAMEDVAALSAKQVKLEKEGGKLSKADETRLANKIDKLAQLNKLLDTRVHIERLSLRSGKSLAEAEQHVVDRLEKQVEFKKQLADQASEDKKAALEKEKRERNAIAAHINTIKRQTSLTKQNTEADADGISTQEAFMAKMAGFSTSVLGYGAAAKLTWEALKKVGEAGDLATETQYNFGTSLSKTSHGIGTYASRALDITKINTELAWSFGMMGLDAKEAEEVIPKLLSSSRLAISEYSKKNYTVVKKMAESAGAFSRQTGVSIDDALQLQNQLIAGQGKTAKQASDDMDGVTGSIKGMNDILTAAGFEGALLNVGEYAHMVKEAAENTEDLSFNVKSYARNLAQAAKNVRLMGATEKEAAKWAATKGKLLDTKNPWLDLQAGKNLVANLQTTYGDDIKKAQASGDNTDLVAKLIEKEQINRTQAETAASLLTSKNPMQQANRLVDVMRGSKSQQSVSNAAIDKTIELSGFKSMSDIAALETNPLVLNALGIQDMNEPDAVEKVTNAAREYLSQHGKIKSTNPKIDAAIKRLEAQKKLDEEEYVKKATEEADAQHTKENGFLGVKQLTGTYRVLGTTGIGLGATGLATALGTKALSKFASDPGRLGKLGSFAEKINRNMNPLNWFGKKAAAPLVSSTLPTVADDPIKAAMNAYTRTAGQSGVGALEKGALQTAEQTGAEALGKGATKAVEREALKAGEKTIMRSILAGAARNPVGAALAGIGAVGATAYGGYKLFSGDSKTEQAKTPENIEAINTGMSSVPSNTANKPDYTETTLDNGIVTGAQAGSGYAIYKGGQLISPYVGKLANKVAPGLMSKASGMAAKTVATETGAKVVGRAIPIIGPIISGAMTAYFTKGSMGRKLTAAAGDAIGTLAGQALTGGFGGGIVGGAAGQFGALELYDNFMADKGDDKVDTSGSLEAASRFNASDSTQAQTQSTQQQAQINQPQAVATGFGRFSSLNSDGSVDTTLNVRITNFAPAVNQAATYNLAKQTQYSGAKR